MTDVARQVTLKTMVPGKQSQAALDLQRSRESNAVSYPKHLPIAIRRAAGSYVEDFDGNVFIDFLTGAGSLPLGHCHPVVVQAAEAQLREFCHGLDFPSEPKQRFHDGVLAMLPESLREKMKVHFCGPTGADAIEAAIKLCKYHTRGDEIISFQGGYHGCTTGAMSVTGLRAAKELIGNRMPGVHFFPYSNCTACPLGLRRTSCEVNCATYLERALDDPNSGLGRPAAVLLELVQGEGGVIPADPEFIRRIREITAKHKIPLVVDEIQTGCGRTGTWFAFEQYNIEPDVVTISKGLSGLGLPVSLMLYRNSMNGWTTGAHIGTFRGNQVAFAAGAAAFEVFAREDVLQNVALRSLQIFTLLDEFTREFSIIGNVRGRGLMIGFDVVTPEDATPSLALAARVQSNALKGGLILERGGRNDTVVRLLPALNVSQQTVVEAMAVLRSALCKAQQWWTTNGRQQLDYSI